MTSESSSAIEVCDVARRFGEVQALDGVSLKVGRGEILGLIGHNGAGKSTLFKLMLGLIEPSAGSVRVHGADTRSAAFRDVRRRIGYLPESFVTYDNLTGLEVLRLFADLKRVPRDACEALLRDVGLQEAAGRRVRGYSKGMRQRLGFAQALLGQPDLIFLDEPTNGLDAEAIHDFYLTLRAVQARGATIVITSHILAEIQQRVDRLVILDRGRVAAEGTLDQLRGALVLPTLIHVHVHAEFGAEVEATLVRAAGEGFDVRRVDDVVEIACMNAEKVAVLQLLAAIPHAVRDIGIRDPSLEDLFFGYGGHHASPR